MELCFEGLRRELGALFSADGPLNHAAISQHLFELLEPMILSLDQLGVLLVGFEPVNDNGRLSFVFARADAMGEDREIAFTPAKFFVGNQDITEWDHRSRANFRIHLLFGSEMFHDARSKEAVSVIIVE